jgi:hypothetical protein
VYGTEIFGVFRLTSYVPLVACSRIKVTVNINSIIHDLKSVLMLVSGGILEFIHETLAVSGPHVVLLNLERALVEFRVGLMSACHCAPTTLMEELMWL